MTIMTEMQAGNTSQPVKEAHGSEPEFVLDDRFAVGVQISEGSVESQNFHMDAANISLPAALCDDKLLEEINAVPDKMGFKIGEVADLLGVKQYVLRYWESEFDVLKPKKAANNQRYYTKRDVENALIIRKLLHRDRFSIEGARAALKDVKSFVKKERHNERQWTSMTNKLDTVHHRMKSLIDDIRRLKVAFQA